MERSTSLTERFDLPAWSLPFAALFVASGAAGLIYQIVWSRQLLAVFGVSAFAVTTVLVSFMAGMALGAALLGRRADRSPRPLRMFALLEAGIGGYAILLPALLWMVDRLHVSIFGWMPGSFLAQSLVRFAFCLALLVVPTALMGATLPALGQGLLRRGGGLGKGVALLYFANTVGAAAGCFVAGFVLMPALGVAGTTAVAVILNALVAVAAYALDQRLAAASPEPAPNARMSAQEAPDDERTEPASWPLWAALGSGMAALAFEVAWFRGLVLVFGSTVYSFAAMLSVFLLGLALGSLAAAWLLERIRPAVRVLALAQGACALFVLLGGLAVNAMPSVFLSLLQALGVDYGGMTRAKFVLSFLTVLPPALAFGASFPVCVHLAGRPGVRVGSRIGHVYAFNTVGAILGAFLTGFVLLPTVGAEWILRLVTLIALALFFGSVTAEVGPFKPRWAWGSGSVLLVLVALFAVQPRWDRRLLGVGVYYQPEKFIEALGGQPLAQAIESHRLMTYSEGYNDTIAGFETPQEKFISVNGSPTASDTVDDVLLQSSQAHLPMALHPGETRSVLIVGLGSGMTAGAAALYRPTRMTVVELEPGVLDGARFFEEENHRVLSYPGLDLRFDDARSFLKLTRERFDVISSNPNFPSLSGAGSLYTTDFLELCRKRLSPGGTVCHWAPLSRLYLDDVRVILRSFLDVFPHVRVFSSGACLFFLGREAPFPPVDVEALAQRLAPEPIGKALLRIGVRGPVELVSSYLFDEDVARRYVGDARPTTDRHPRLEFSAPRAVFARTVGENFEAIAAFRPTPEARLQRLGLAEAYHSSFLALASAFDAAVDGQVLLAKGKLEEGMRLLIPAASAGQSFARYLVARQAERSAITLQAQGQLEAAREQFAISRELNPDQLDARLALGSLDLVLGRAEEAERELQETTERFPRSGQARFRLGLARSARGDEEGARAHYEKAALLEPALPEPHILLGVSWLAAGKPAEALESLERGFSLGGGGEEAEVALVRVLLALHRAPEALAAARLASQSYRTSVLVAEAHAEAAAAAGEAAEGEAARARAEQLRKALPSTTP